DVRDCRDMVRYKLGLPHWKDRARTHAQHGHLRPKVSISSTTAPHLLALQIFDCARSLRGTIGEIYLKHRIGCEMDWPADIRSHPSGPRRVGEQIERHPALVVLLRDIFTNEPRAIQRIFLRPDG